ncbi:MAG: hypothetical protein WBQ78_05695 [Gammaproteobacteria bacterium]
MNDELAEIMCSALNSDRSIDELAIKLGEIKTRIRHERTYLDSDREIITKLQSIEALLERMILHGFYKEQHRVSSKPVLKIIK